MKAPANPARVAVCAQDVCTVLEGFRPYGHHRHTRAEHAKYFRVTPHTIAKWKEHGICVGMYKHPDRTTWMHVCAHAAMYYRDTLSRIDGITQVLYTLV